MAHTFVSLSGRSPRSRAAEPLLNPTPSSLPILKQPLLNWPPSRRVLWLPLALFALTLAGCASTPPPDGSMNQAQSLLQAARDAGASDYAPVDLGYAQNRFQQAQAAFADRKYDVAASLADEASADAELARAKARLGAARAQIQDKTDANNQLRQQMEAAHPANGGADQGGNAGAGFAPVQADPTTTPNDMPAPPSSAISEPVPQGQDFQTMPGSNAPTSNDQGGHP